MNIELDTHTHTIVSGHAYSTLNEMAFAAKEKGLKLIGNTDHAPAMPGSPHIFHFNNLKVIPNYIHGVRILKGVEANIINFNGDLDLDLDVLNELELVIASFHPPCITPSTKSKTTNALLNLMNNKNVNIIGHPEDNRYSFDINEVVIAAKESQTLLEINNSSLLPTSYRENSRAGIINILESCANYNVPVIMGSDAHHTSAVGRFDMAVKVIEEINFPKELVLNYSCSKFLKYIGVDF